MKTKPPSINNSRGQNKRQKDQITLSSFYLIINLITIQSRRIGCTKQVLFDHKTSKSPALLIMNKSQQKDKWQVPAKFYNKNPSPKRRKNRTSRNSRAPFLSITESSHQVNEIAHDPNPFPQLSNNTSSISHGNERKNKINNHLEKGTWFSSPAQTAKQHCPEIQGFLADRLWRTPWKSSNRQKRRWIREKKRRAKGRGSIQPQYPKVISETH